MNSQLNPSTKDWDTFKEEISRPQPYILLNNRQPLSMYGWVEKTLSPRPMKKPRKSIVETRGECRKKHRLLREGIGQSMLLVFYYRREGNERADLTITGCESLPCHDHTRICWWYNFPSGENIRELPARFPYIQLKRGGKVARQYSSASTTLFQCQTTPVTE